jgi:hypothetical protein
VSPLLVGEAKCASSWIMRLPHELFRYGGIPDPDGSASLGGGADAGGAMREGVGEADGVVDLGARVP